MTTVSVGSIKLKNPLILGSCGLAISPRRLERAVQSGFGAVILKSVTDIEALQSPDITRWKWLDDNSLLSVGGPMLPLSAALETLPEMRAIAAPENCLLMGSVCAQSPEGWEHMAAALASAGVSALEINLGNPHVLAPFKVHDVVALVKKTVSLPIIVKVPRDHAADSLWIEAALDAGADVLMLAHRPLGLVYDHAGIPYLGGPAGFSGPWLGPLTLALIDRWHRTVKTPLIAGGGLFTAQDIKAALGAGASAVEMTTAFYRHGIDWAREILRQLDSMTSNERTD